MTSCLQAVRCVWVRIIWRIRKNTTPLAEKVVYTGTIDSYFGYRFGRLQYRSLRFETEVLDTDNFQGNAVINYIGPGDALIQDHRAQDSDVWHPEK